jgi:hypothetical protein
MVAVPCARVFSRLLGTAFSLMFVPCGDSALRGSPCAAFTGFARGAALSAPRSCGRRCAASPDACRLLVPRLLLAWSSGLWLCFAAVSGLVAFRLVFWLFWILRHLLWQVAPFPSMLSIHRCPAVDAIVSGVDARLVGCQLCSCYLWFSVLCCARLRHFPRCLASIRARQLSSWFLG